MDIKICILVLTLTAQVYSIPRESRYRRQAVAVAGADSSSGASAGVQRDNNDFGIGAAAGIGGLGRSAGIGNFRADTRTNPFLPWGAFAGLNLGNGGRIGAGCSGLSCGVQLGDFVLATPQLLGMGENFGRNTGNANRQERDVRYGENYAYAGAGGGNNYRNDPYQYSNEYYDDDSYYNNYPRYGSSGGYGYGYNDQYPRYNYHQSQSFPSAFSFDPNNLLQGPLRLLQQIQQQNQDNLDKTQQNVADFARFGAPNGGGQSFGGGSTSTFVSSNSNGGKPVFSSSSTHVDSNGKVTTIQSGSDQPDKITTGRIGEGSTGVFAASGTKVDSDGKLSSFRNTGTF